MTELFLAADFSDITPARQIIEAVYPFIDTVKIGLEAMNARHNKQPLADLFAEVAKERGKSVMWDAKLKDIGNTMGQAVKNIVALGHKFVTVHADASKEALETVEKESRGKTTPLAISVLTDIDDTQCLSIYGWDRKAQVAFFARRAWSAGIRGMVCSPLEIEIIRNDALAGNMTLVVPGIRPTWAVANDQKNIATPAFAKKIGANAIVVGRPITNPPAGMTPRDAALRIREELDKA